MNKNTITFNYLKSEYPIIFNHNDLLNCNWDNNQAFVGFIIGLCKNQLGDSKLKELINQYQNDWINLFKSLYQNTEVINEANKIEQYKKDVSSFSNKSYQVFEKFINDFVDFLKSKNIDLNINNEQLKTLILDGFSYLFYNKLNLKIYYQISDNILDPDYENKLHYLINNTKLFSNLKQSVFNCCGTNINDFIVLILGMSNQLNQDK